MLIIDGDNRFGEVKMRTPELKASGLPQSDCRDPRAIAKALKEGSPNHPFKTIAVDSLTPILTPYITEAMASNAANERKNKASGWVDKANAVKMVCDAVSGMGCDYVFIWHKLEGRNGNAEKFQKSSIPETEKARMMRVMNAVIELGKDEKGRFAKIVWSRFGVRDVIVRDQHGMWKGVVDEIDRIQMEANIAQQVFENPFA